MSNHNHIVTSCKQHVKLSRSNNQIRDNLLMKLGFLRNASSNVATAVGGGCAKQRIAPLNITLKRYHKQVNGGLSSYHECIKFDIENDGNWTSTSSSSSSLPPQPPPSTLPPPLRQDEKMVVRFDKYASIVTIPSLDDYSERTIKRLWVSAEEEYHGRRRNAIEFHAEGKNWRWALEEEDMYWDRVTNTLIHPVHVVPDEIKRCSPPERTKVNHHRKQMSRSLCTYRDLTKVDTETDIWPPPQTPSPPPPPSTSPPPLPEDENDLWLHGYFSEVSIPSRDDYSECTAERSWVISKEEYHQDKTHNAIEHLAEDRTWRCALEEEEQVMVSDENFPNGYVRQPAQIRPNETIAEYYTPLDTGPHVFSSAPEPALNCNYHRSTSPRNKKVSRSKHPKKRRKKESSIHGRTQFQDYHYHHYELGYSITQIADT